MKVLTEIFAEHKLEALKIRDVNGENLLFTCAKNGNENIFRWFMGSNEYCNARNE
jgi:hypothetical protein